MYESPIRLNEIATHISEGIAKATDEYIFAQVNMAVDVDKEELIKALSYDRNQYQKGYADGYADAKAERKTGKWIFKNDMKQFFCDKCAEPSLTYDDVYIYSMDLPKFCPNCGAKMEEGDQDAERTS